MKPSELISLAGQWRPDRQYATRRRGPTEKRKQPRTGPWTWSSGRLASGVRSGGKTALRISTGTWQRTRPTLTGTLDSPAPTREDLEFPSAAIFDLDGTLLDS